MISSASSLLCWRPPTATTCALLCSRASAAVSVPCQSRTDTLNLVRSHLFAVAATAEHDTQGVQAASRSRFTPRAALMQNEGSHPAGRSRRGHGQSFVARSGEGLDQIVAQPSRLAWSVAMYAHGTLLVICLVRRANCVRGRRRFSVLTPLLSAPRIHQVGMRFPVEVFLS